GYIQDRLSGLELDTVGALDRAMNKHELAQFPEYYRAYLGGKAKSNVGSPPLVCTGPVTYIGKSALQTDLDNLQSAVAQTQVEEAFMPAMAPRIVGRNEHYRSAEEFLEAIARAMHVEYSAIVDAGLILQLDDPYLTAAYSDDPYALRPEAHIEMI